MSTDDWQWKMRQLERERQERRRREQRRLDWFVVDRKPIPDLEFLTPECPVCGLFTSVEDDYFQCEECQITWPRSGYGDKATLDPEAPHNYWARAGEGS